MFLFWCSDLQRSRQLDWRHAAAATARAAKRAALSTAPSRASRTTSIPPSPTPGRLDGDVQHLHPAADLQARGRRRGQRSDPRPGQGNAEDQRRRKDLHPLPPPRPQILRRHRRSRPPTSPTRSNASSRPTPAARPSTPASSAPKSSPKPRPAASPGIETDDKTGEIVIHLTKPRGTFTNELGLMFVAPVPPGHAEHEPVDQPATGDRSLHDHQGRPRQRLELRAQPLLGESQLEGDARPAQRPHGQDQHHDHPQRLDPGQRNPAGQVRLDADAAAAGPLSRTEKQIRGHPVPGREHDQHLLLLDEHRTGRRSTTSRFAKPSTTRSIRRRWNGSTSARWSAPSRSCRRGCRATRNSSSSRTTSPKRRR